MRCTCGYDGHRGPGKVRFISRYKDENDYCVEGVRITLWDNGRCDGTPEQAEALRLYLLDQYADTIRWRVEYFRPKLGEPGPLPAFHAPGIER